MPFRLSKTLRERPGDSEIASTVREHEEDFRAATNGGPEAAEDVKGGVSNLGSRRYTLRRRARYVCRRH